MIPSLVQIEAMDREGLSTCWKEIFATEVPARLSMPFLRRFLAFEVQSRQSGGLPPGFVQKLAKAAAEQGAKCSPTLKPGGRLIREWNGVTHIVDVGAGAYYWNGELHASLSSIARAITGARWSGPRFFGLNGGVST